MTGLQIPKSPGVCRVPPVRSGMDFWKPRELQRPHPPPWSPSSLLPPPCSLCSPPFSVVPPPSCFLLLLPPPFSSSSSSSSSSTSSSSPPSTPTSGGRGNLDNIVRPLLPPPLLFPPRQSGKAPEASSYIGAPVLPPLALRRQVCFHLISSMYLEISSCVGGH